MTLSQPASFEGYDWDVFSSSRRFACVLFIIGLLDAVQLSVFFLKYALWYERPTYAKRLRNNNTNASCHFLAKASIKASICQDRLGTASQLQRSLELKQRERDFEHVFPPPGCRPTTGL